MDEILKTSGKLLGVDFGDVRTGIAVSDSGRRIASGLRTISAGGIRKAAVMIAQTASEEKVSGIIVGLPVNMDGSHGPRAEHAEHFSCLVREELERIGLNIPVVTFDERMTTMAASRFLNETDTCGKKRKAVIDTLSAQIILQNALDRLAVLKNT